MDHASVMNSCSDKAHRAGLAVLTPIERIVHLVSWANFEIECGGISTFYFNSAGDHAVETVAALEAVGAFKAAAALRAANAVFPGGPPVDRGQRWERLRLLGKAARFEPFDLDFYAESPDVFSRLCSFIDEHQAELQHLNC